MGFIKLHDAEILKLATGGPDGKAIAGDGWALYCNLRRHAWELKKGSKDTKGWRRYYSYPSQSTICEELGWPLPKKRPCGNWDTSQKVSRAVKRLVKAGLIVVISSQATDKRSKQIRGGLGRSAGRGHVYHLSFWEKLMTDQKRHGSRDQNDSAEIKNDMRANSKKTCKKETLIPSVEEKNNNIIIYEEENSWEVPEEAITSKHGIDYSKSQIESMLVEDRDTAEELILSQFTVGELETVSKWFEGWKDWMELDELSSAVIMRRLGG